MQYINHSKQNNHFITQALRNTNKGPRFMINDGKNINVHSFIHQRKRNNASMYAMLCKCQNRIVRRILVYFLLVILFTFHEHNNIQFSCVWQ